MMSEARKVTAQYLNGIAVAILATVGAAYIGGEVSGVAVLLAAFISAILHAVAVWVVTSG